METISILHFFENFVSVIPVRERAFLLVALALSTIVWMFCRKLQSLAEARPKGYAIDRAAAADEPRLDDALVDFVAGSKVSAGILDAAQATRLHIARGESPAWPRQLATRGRSAQRVPRGFEHSADGAIRADARRIF